MVIIRLKLLAIFRMVHDMPGKRVRLIFFNIPERTGHHNILLRPGNRGCRDINQQDFKKVSRILKENTFDPASNAIFMPVHHGPLPATVRSD